MTDHAPTIPRPRPRASLRKRLWLAGGGIGLFLLTLAVAGPLIDRDRAGNVLGLGYDFVPAYVAGYFARTGQFDKMYDREASVAVQDRIVREAGLEMDGRYGAGLNPPHFALLFAPLSALPYRTAAAVWLAANVVMFAASLVLLVRLLPEEARRDWRTWGLVPLLVTASMPFVQAAGHQQNTFLSLLILAATVTLWRRGRGFLAGAAAGLLFYKPQLACVVAAVLMLDQGRRAVLGLGLAGTLLFLATVLFLPGSLDQYVQSLGGNLEWLQTRHQYNWGRQATFLGFARLLVQGQALGPHAVMTRIVWLGGASLGFAALAATFVRTRVRAFSQTPDGLIAATVAATPLLLPYYLDYDLLLLSVPATLFAADLLRQKHRGRADRRLIGAWVALYLWSYANPALSGMMRLSLTVPLLSAVAAGLMLRATRPAPAAGTGDNADASAPAETPARLAA